MNTYILLLRGINVGGHKKIKMAEFKTALEKLKFKEVQTYIQSGNVIFKHAEENLKTLTEIIESTIIKKYNFETKALVIGAKEFIKIFINNPYLPEKENELEKLYCTLLLSVPEESKIALLKEVDSPQDEFIFGLDCIYFLYHNGYGKAKISNPLVESKLKVSATTRNWKTITKLVEMISEK
jgi:uncharacterized protein (DUF1697 family)